VRGSSTHFVRSPHRNCEILTVLLRRRHRTVALVPTGAAETLPQLGGPISAAGRISWTEMHALRLWREVANEDSLQTHPSRSSERSTRGTTRGPAPFYRRTYPAASHSPAGSQDLGDRMQMTLNVVQHSGPQPSLGNSTTAPCFNDDDWTAPPRQRAGAWRNVIAHLGGTMPRAVHTHIRSRVFPDYTESNTRISSAPPAALDQPIASSNEFPPLEQVFIAALGKRAASDRHRSPSRGSPRSSPVRKRRSMLVFRRHTTSLTMSSGHQ